MNLHQLVSGHIAAVNPFLTGSIKVSTGTTTAADGKRTPSYTTIAGVPMQVQALSGRDLRQLESLNIQGVSRAVYLNGNIEGLDRPAGKGGDLILVNGATWLVTTVLETWDAAGWCKLGLTLQS